MNQRKIFLLTITVMGSALMTTSTTFAGSDTIVASSNAPISSFGWKAPTLSSWWKGTNALANWFGLGPVMNDYGLSITGSARDVYFGQVSGGFQNNNQPKSNFIEEVKLKAVYDFGKMFNIDGLSIISTWRYRNVGANNPAYAAGTMGVTGNWSPSDISSGFGMRMLAQMLQYTTPDKVWTINGGMENPYDQFLQQPLSKTFENNMINSTKGIGMQQGPGIPVAGGSGGYSTPYNSLNNLPRNYGAASVGWSSSYLAWGGTLNVKPVKNVYLQSGLYEAVPGASGVAPTQFSATSVYPYTSVPASYAGAMKASGQIVPVVGGNGMIIPNASQNIGWVASYQNNHGFTFGGSPANNFPTQLVNVKPTANSAGTTTITGIPNGTPAGAATYKNSAGQTVAAPAFYASTPYNQQGVGGNYSGNGLFNMNELGWTPKLGADKLEGHYALGSYIWGEPNYSYTPTTYSVSVYNPTTGYTATSAYSKKPFQSQYNGAAFGFYLQADQMLFRYHKADTDSNPFTSDGKNPVGKSPSAPHSFSDRGLYLFSEANFTPPQNNAMPLYFQVGLVYKGLLNCRPKDSIGAVFGSGFYSSYFNSYQQTQNQAYENAVTSAYNATVPNGPTQAQNVNATTGKISGNYNNYYAYLPNYTSTQVIEAYYNVQFNNWMNFKPYVQCIVNPAGNGTLNNDWTLGARLAVIF